jgi:hypothetical protein
VAAEHCRLSSVVLDATVGDVGLVILCGILPHFSASRGLVI